MGTIRSKTNLSGSMVNGILLGDPAQDGDEYIWDDSRIPDIYIVVATPVEQ